MKRIITGTPIKFKDCQNGDIFSISINVIMNNNVYLNIKVTPSLTLKYADKGSDYAFNSICLEDGRPRTYHPDVDVFLFDRNEIFK